MTNQAESTQRCCKLQNNTTSKIVNCKQRCESIGMFGSNRSCIPGTDTTTWKDVPIQQTVDQRYLENLPPINIATPNIQPTEDYYCICSNTNNSTSNDLIESVIGNENTEQIIYPTRNPNMIKYAIILVVILLLFSGVDAYKIMKKKSKQTMIWCFFDIAIIIGLLSTYFIDKKFNGGRCFNFLSGEATATQLWSCNNPAYYSTMYDLMNQLNDARNSEAINRETLNRETEANLSCNTRMHITGGQNIQYVCPLNTLCDTNSEGMVVRNCLCKNGSWIAPNDWVTPSNSCEVETSDQQDVMNRCTVANQNQKNSINYKGRRCFCNADGTISSLDQYTGQTSRQSNTIGERFFCPPMGHAIDEENGTTSVLSEACWCNQNRNNIGQVFSTGHRFNCECSSTPSDGSTTAWILTDKPATPNFTDWDASATENCGNQICNFTESTSQYLNPQLYYESNCTQAGIPTAVESS